MSGDFMDDHRFHRRLQEHRFGVGRSEYGPTRNAAAGAPPPDAPTRGDRDDVAAPHRHGRRRMPRGYRLRARALPVARRARRAANHGAAWFAAVGLCPVLILYDLEAYPALGGPAIRARLPRPENFDRWLAGRAARWAALAREAWAAGPGAGTRGLAAPRPAAARGSRGSN